MGRPKITIVVCTYNRAALLRHALESLVSLEMNGAFSYDIVVVDDGSTDETKHVANTVVASSDVPIKYVYEEGGGIARARNTGIREASGEWVAFTDDDQVADPEPWLKELVSLVTERGLVCAGGARRLRLLDGSLDSLSPICRRILGEIDEGRRVAKYPRGSYPCTGNVLMNRSVYESVGPFDESLKWGGSDIEFFKRVERAGIETWYTPTAIVHHLTPGYRVKDEYLLWKSVAQGANFATRDFRAWGLTTTLLACAARLGQALFINAPRLSWAYAVGDEPDKLGRKCLLRRANGYARQCLSILAPGTFHQDTFFRNLEFRREQEIFLKSSPLGEEQDLP